MNPHLALEALLSQLMGRGAAGAGTEAPWIHLSPPPQPQASQSPPGTKECGPVLTGPQASWPDRGGPGQLAQQGMAVGSGPGVEDPPHLPHSACDPRGGLM